MIDFSISTPTDVLRLFETLKFEKVTRIKFSPECITVMYCPKIISTNAVYSAIKVLKGKIPEDVVVVPDEMTWCEWKLLRCVEITYSLIFWFRRTILNKGIGK